MGKGIKLSKQHGANPSMQVCFFCGKAKGLIMFGHLKGDAKAPDKVLTDYEPCEECAEKFKQGILWVEVQDAPLYEDQPPLQRNAWPTGRWALTTEKLLDILHNVEEVRKHRKAVVHRDVFEALNLDKNIKEVKHE